MSDHGTDTCSQELLAQSLRTDYRNECFGAQGGEDAPFWIPMYDADGESRTEADALALVRDYWGATEDMPWTVTVSEMHVGPDGHGGLTVRNAPFADSHGPHLFWHVDEP